MLHFPHVKISPCPIFIRLVPMKHFYDRVDQVQLLGSCYFFYATIYIMESSSLGHLFLFRVQLDHVIDSQDGDSSLGCKSKDLKGYGT
jgi:hypothetical protein